MSIFGCMGTSEEIRGIEAVREVFRDLQHRFERAKSRVIEDHTGLTMW